MGEFIKTVDLGLSVFGQAQVGYSVGGVTGQSYGDAAAMAGLQRATSVETSIAAYEKMMRLRQRKVNELGEALSYIAESVGRFPAKGGSTSDTQSVNANLKTILDRYGVTVRDITVSTSMTKHQLQMTEQAVQYAMDVESNNLQQDMATLQSLVNRRDDAFQLAAKIARKAAQTFTSGVRAMG